AGQEHRHVRPRRREETRELRPHAAHEVLELGLTMAHVATEQRIADAVRDVDRARVQQDLAPLQDFAPATFASSEALRKRFEISGGSWTTRGARSSGSPPATSARMNAGPSCASARSTARPSASRSWARSALA